MASRVAGVSVDKCPDRLDLSLELKSEYGKAVPVTVHSTPRPFCDGPGAVSVRRRLLPHI